MLQAKEGIPIVKGNVVADVTALKLGRWERMGAMGCYLNLSNQQLTDVYVCEIAPGGQTLPQRHLFEEIIYVAKGRGATSVWQEGAGKVTFEWAQGAIFAIPLNASVHSLQRFARRTSPPVCRHDLPAHDQYFSQRGFYLSQSIQF